MKRFLLRLLLFVSPFLFMIGVELFILPIDFFTFRVWEAVLIKEFKAILPGRFYPLMDITKIETRGDLAPPSSHTIPRKVRWVTDRYGFRKKDAGEIKPQVVIVGDSNIAGGGLTQEEMLSEALEDQLKVPVYPYAPVGFNAFLKDLRFEKDPPRVVIVSVIERHIFDLPAPKIRKKKGGLLFFYEWMDKIRQMRGVQRAGVVMDRFCKMNMLQYARARIGNKEIREVYRSPSKFGPMLFLRWEETNKEVPKAHLEKVVKTIEAYDRVLRKKGIRFIFLPIPNKENIYHEYLPNAGRPIFLEQLIQELKNKGIETVDTQKAFEDEVRKNSTLLYFPDDTHWNARGVRLAADRTVELIKKEN